MAAGSAARKVLGVADSQLLRQTVDAVAAEDARAALRALAVYHELLKHDGVDSSRIAVVGYGEHRPVPGRPETLRRVEIRLLPAEDALPAPSPAGP